MLISRLQTAFRGDPLRNYVQLCNYLTSWGAPRAGGDLLEQGWPQEALPFDAGRLRKCLHLFRPYIIP